MTATFKVNESMTDQRNNYSSIISEDVGEGERQSIISEKFNNTEEHADHFPV